MIQKIRDRLKSIAMLEAIICPEWDDRYYSYNANWAEGEEVASMRDGSGDEWFLWVKNDLAALKVLSHEFTMLSEIDSIKKQFPASYFSFITEPAFSVDDSTSLWYLTENQWIKFDANAEETIKLIQVFEWTAEDYKQWADDYYEDEFSLPAINNIISGHLSEKDIQLLNEDLSYKDLEDDISEIGYNRIVE